MDRARRAEPYSNATIWTREIARNLAGHLDRLSKVQSCIDTKSPKSTLLPKFHHKLPPKRPVVASLSPIKKPTSTSSTTAEAGDAVPRDESSTAAPTSIHVSDASRPQLNEIESRRQATRPDTSTPSGTLKAALVRRQSESIPHNAVDAMADATASHDRRDHHKVSSQSNSTYETHAAERPALDYHRRKEQRKIWQENQALAKRLRNTKPTLNAKEWEKDDKWNQQFLKTHERRRQALQQELNKTLSSPHAALVRTKAGVAPKPTDLMSSNEQDDYATSGIRDFRRRRSSDDVVSSEEQRRLNSAANHRRIMQLRQQKTTSALQEQSSSSEAPGPPDELVEVRFTFSRGRGRLAELATPNGISGQFSPAVELERTLENLLDEQMTPTVVLQEPVTSRLDEDDGTDDDVGQVVFAVLQSCIDIVATLEEQDEQCEVDFVSANDEEDEGKHAQGSCTQQNGQLSNEVDIAAVEAEEAVVHGTIQEQVDGSCAKETDKADACTPSGANSEPAISSSLTGAGIHPDDDVGGNDHEFDDDDFEAPSPTPRVLMKDVSDDDANEAQLYEDDLEPQAEDEDEDDPYAADDFSD